VTIPPSSTAADFSARGFLFAVVALDKNQAAARCIGWLRLRPRIRNSVDFPHPRFREWRKKQNIRTNSDATQKKFDSVR